MNHRKGVHMTFTRDSHSLLTTQSALIASPYNRESTLERVKRRTYRVHGSMYSAKLSGVTLSSLLVSQDQADAVS